MNQGDAYRRKAAEFAAKAKTIVDPVKKAEHSRMAAAYLRLAEQADRNEKNDVVYETPPPPKPRE